MKLKQDNDDLRATWFGRVSPTWKLGRAKNAFRIISKKVGERHSEHDLLSLTLKGIIRRDVDSGKGKFPESFDTYQEVKKSDIVFCLFDVDETPRTVGLSRFDGMITGAYTVVRCSQTVDPRFVTYFYLSIDERKGLRPFYTGLRKVVRTETFLNATFPFPDLSTQREIADFLDRETARIDLLIEKKQKLVAVLGEKRSTTITEAVTGAGNRRSAEGGGGVKIQLRRVVNVGNTRSQFREDLRPYIGLEHITSWTGEIIASDEATPDGLITHFKKGDILFGKLRPYLAKVTAPNFNGVCSTEAIVIKPSKRVITRFLRYSLSSETFIDRVNATTFGTKMPRANWESIGSEAIWIPDLSTQREIADFLDRETARIDAVKEKTLLSVDRLKEYRSALITAAVTGQIDVTTYAKSGTTDRRLDAIQEEMGA